MRDSKPLTPQEREALVVRLFANSACGLSAQAAAALAADGKRIAELEAMEKRAKAFEVERNSPLQTRSDSACEILYGEYSRKTHQRRDQEDAERRGYGL